MGMCLFMGIDTINIRVLKRRVPVPKTIDWYLGVGLETSFVKNVVEKYKDVQNKMVASGNVFCAILPQKYDVKIILNEENAWKHEKAY